ncbi:MAG: hypothetical protein AAGN82_05295 [Myxococcota bacterium]
MNLALGTWLGIAVLLGLGFSSWITVLVFAGVGFGFCAFVTWASWVDRRSLIDLMARRTEFVDATGIAEPRDGYRGGAKPRIHASPDRVPLRHRGKLFLLSSPFEEGTPHCLRGERVAMAEMTRTWPWDEKFVLRAHDFFVADKAGRVVLFSWEAETKYLEGLEKEVRLGSQGRCMTPELGARSFYDSFLKVWSRSSKTSLTHGADVELVGWTIPAEVPGPFLDSIQAQTGGVADIWVVGTNGLHGGGYISVRPLGPAEAV